MSEGWRAKALEYHRAVARSEVCGERGRMVRPARLEREALLHPRKDGAVRLQIDQNAVCEKSSNDPAGARSRGAAEFDPQEPLAPIGS
jgi:hypothetical protein